MSTYLIYVCKEYPCVQNAFICSLFSADKKVVEVEFKDEEIIKLQREITHYDSTRQNKMSFSYAIRRKKRIELDVLPDPPMEIGQERERTRVRDRWEWRAWIVGHSKN